MASILDLQVSFGRENDFLWRAVYDDVKQDRISKESFAWIRGLRWKLRISFWLDLHYHRVG